MAKKPADRYNEKEKILRLEKALRSALSTPPKPRMKTKAKRAKKPASAAPR